MNEPVGRLRPDVSPAEFDVEREKREAAELRASELEARIVELEELLRGSRATRPWRLRLAKVVAPLPVLARDGAGVCGAALVSYGSWLVYKPAGFIMAGALLIVTCVLLARGEGQS